ncbi:MAG: AbgT family transporter [Tepidibacter sp.]|jgi:aminobenzoyl-glutamate transport protein|uniref:AbgT family transporter n=1 Tax=Tepidibacter sp. TaxID=2529387 RepID=UPI0025DCBE8E|nr:AbgT family transporter [Tepidibacter sp.]MCT4507673.1 AbgT family transporter [Tepidibacter sp.]
MEKAQVKDNKFFSRLLNGIEIVGNKLPDPVTLFAILCGLIVILSKVLFILNVSVVHPLTQETVSVVDLMSKNGLRGILTGIVGNFQGFPPLGLVLVVMLGAGVAEKSGLMETALKSSISKVPNNLITGMIVFVGILANAAGDAGFIVLPPLAAIVFLGIGRHPLIGMFAAYAGVAGGFSANIMVSMIDVLLGGFTIPAAQMIDPSYQATPAMNFYFLLASTIIILIASVIITEKIIAPRFDKYDGDSDSELVSEISEDEKKGIKWAGISLVLMLVLVVGLCIGDNAFMKDPETNSLLASKAALMKGLVPIITLMFFIPGLIYGKITKKIKNDKDVVAMMGQSMSEMGMYIVLAFAASQFLALFTISNIGVIISVKGAEFLKNMGFTGFGLIIGFIILSGFINLFVGSASAKWAIMAPVFVPMFLLLDYNPAVTQVAYRIGDSITNPISPLFPYFPIILAFARKYDKKAGMGTIIANMLPYSIVYAILWMILLVIFMKFNIPLGPGAGIYM